MLRLSSGRIVDLSTNRAKFHALQQRGPAADATHRALYALVDVIVRLRHDNGEPGRGWTEHDYLYSGYTLANIHLAEDWIDADKNELFHWVNEKTQKLRIETARRRLLDHQPQLSVTRHCAPRHLYSLLQARVEALPQQRASAAQWLATINNLQQSGIRQEEIHWSGLAEFLSRQAADHMLGKEQVLAEINFSNTRLELSTEQICDTSCALSFREVAHRMPHQVVYRAALKLDESCLCILRYVDDTYNYRIGVIKTRSYEHHMALNKYWFALDPYGRAIVDEADGESPQRYYSDGKAALAAASRHARGELGTRCSAKDNTRYDHLTLFGGHDYREWIVSLPDYQRTFFGAHYFDHNVLVHIRTTTRHNSEGKKLLFIEEVQSDWHQNGHTHGYDTSYWGRIANAPFKKEWPALAIKLMLIHASQHGFDGIAWPDGEIQETRYTRQLQAIKRHYDTTIPRALNRLGRRFHCRVERSGITTRDPWLNLVRSRNKWRVSDGRGKFQTRDRYHSRAEAMRVMHRHCKTIHLPVSVYLINEPLRRQIAEQGLPLFGDATS